MLRLIGRAAQQVDARAVALAHVLNADERLLGIIGGDERGEERAQQQRAQQDHADDGRLLAEEPSQCQPPERIGAIVADAGDGGVVQWGQSGDWCWLGR